MLVVAVLALCSPGVRAARRPPATRRRRSQDAEAASSTSSTSPRKKSARSARTSARRSAQRFGVVQDPAVHKYVTLVGHAARAAVGAAEPAVDVHRARHRRRQRVRLAGRLRPHHARRARPDQERSGAGRRARPRDRPRRAQAHGERHQEEQGGADGHQRDAVGSRPVPRSSSRTRPTRWCSRTPSTAATSSTPTRSSLMLAQKAGYAPATLADFLTRLDERNKDQPEQQRPVRVASRDEGAHRQDPQAGRPKNGAVVEARYKAQHQIHSRRRSPRSPPSKDGASGLTGSAKARRQERRREARQEPRSRRRRASASAV